MEFKFKNKYNEETYLDFKEKEMIIKEVYIDKMVREYSFNYSDISSYNIIPNKTYKLYEVTFLSNDKKIQRIEENKTTMIHGFTILAGEVDFKEIETKIYSIECQESNLKKIIHDNSPLRGNQDKMDDTRKAIDKAYEYANSDTLGNICIAGLKKDLCMYYIEINDIPYFVLNASFDKNVNLEKANLCWVNNNTVSFNIPFGEWKISYSYHEKVNSIAEHDRNSSITGPKGITVLVNSKHTTVNIKPKMGLFSSKLVEK